MIRKFTIIALVLLIAAAITFAGYAYNAEVVSTCCGVKTSCCSCEKCACDNCACAKGSCCSEKCCKCGKECKCAGCKCKAGTCL
jgi:hypothetical protein